MKTASQRIIPVQQKKTLSYGSLVLVILLWGIAPFVSLYYYDFYSPTIMIAFNALVSAAALLLLSLHDLDMLNKTHFKVAIPTAFFYATANILQKIGLQYTTPTRYSFLENLSCVVVPVLLFFFIGKKPKPLTVLASLLCLVSTFILNGVAADTGGAIGIGEVLCGLAGIFYGVNIAATGAFAKELHAPLYLMIQMFVEAIISFLAAIAFSLITVGGAPIEPIRFSFDLWTMAGRAVTTLFLSTFCWVLRTNAMKTVDPSAVAIMMPFSSVVTTVISICIGSDTLSANLVVGVTLGMMAIILSGLGDKVRIKKKRALYK